VGPRGLTILGIESGTTWDKDKKMLVTRKNILDANRYGLQTDWGAGDFRTPVLQVACYLGREGVDLSQQPDFTGWRYGRGPETGISHNHRDDFSERGLSLAVKPDGSEVESTIWFSGEKYTYTGLLLPFTGSDGEALILPYHVENFDI
jgi:hypothetical protein